MAGDDQPSPIQQSGRRRLTGMEHCSQCKTIKPDADFYARKSRPSGLSVWCRDCSRRKNREAMKRFAEKHPEDNRDRQRAYREDPDFVKARREAARKAYRDNPSIVKESIAKWRSENPEKVREWVANRKAAQLQATPAWANREYIKLWYAFAKSESKRTGLAVEVDHIVPLKSKFVCGLHNEHNMQLLCAHQNNVKGNRVWPDMP